MADAKVREVDLGEAREIIERTGKKFVWVLGQTRVSIPEVLDVSDSKVLAIAADEIPSFDEAKLRLLDGCVLVCAHGNTSGAVARYLKSRNVDAYNLKGGIAAIIGENY